MLSESTAHILLDISLDASIFHSYLIIAVAGGSDGLLSQAVAYSVGDLLGIALYVNTGSF